MRQHQKLCEDDHPCHACGKIVLCQTYKWACPWRNDDEDQMCDSCLEEVKKSMEEFMAEQKL